MNFQLEGMRNLYSRFESNLSISLSSRFLLKFPKKWQYHRYFIVLMNTLSYQFQLSYSMFWFELFHFNSFIKNHQISKLVVSYLTKFYRKQTEVLLNSWDILDFIPMIDLLREMLYVNSDNDLPLCSKFTNMNS